MAYNPINIAAAAGTQTATSGTVIFSNSNGVSFGMSNSSVMTASVSQAGQAVSASGGSSSFQTLVFTNSNGLTFTNTGGSIAASYTVPSTAGLISAINVSASNTSANQSNIVFSNSNGVSFGLSNSTLTASVSQAGQAVSASGGSSSFQTLVFTNSNGLTFTNTGGSIAASYTVPSTAGLISAINVSASNTSANQSNIVFSNSNGMSFGLSDSTITASFSQAGQAVSASNGSFNFSTLNFSNANNVTIGTSAGSIVTASVNTSSFSATGGLSLSTNGSTVSVGYGPQLSRFEWNAFGIGSVATVPQGTLSIQQFEVPFNITATQALVGVSISQATNTSATTASVNQSMYMGIYTFSGSTLSLATSGSSNVGWRGSMSASTTANTSINSNRQLSLSMSMNLTPGLYYMGMVFSSATTYTSVSPLTLYGNTLEHTVAGLQLTPIGSNTSAGRPYVLGEGIYTAATGGLPASIASNAYNFTAASNVEQANFYFQLLNNTY